MSKKTARKIMSCLDSKKSTNMNLAFLYDKCACFIPRKKLLVSQKILKKYM